MNIDLKPYEEATKVGLEFLERVKSPEGKATNYSKYKVEECGHE